MSNIFDITKFDLYKEDNRREVKKSNGGLPSSLFYGIHTLHLPTAMAE